MEHVTELQVERLLVSPEALTPPEHACIVNHLIRCPACRRTAEVQVAFYNELYRADDSDAPRRSVDQFLERLLTPDHTPAEGQPRRPSC